MAYIKKLKQSQRSARSRSSLPPAAAGGAGSGLVLYPTSYSDIDLKGDAAKGKARTIKAELRGSRGHPEPFTLGGKYGNVVTRSQTPFVVKGWRAVSLNGVSLKPSLIGAAVLKANERCTSYTVNFIDPFAGPGGTKSRLPKIGQPQAKAAGALAAAAALAAAEKNRLAEREKARLQKEKMLQQKQQEQQQQQQHEDEKEAAAAAAAVAEINRRAAALKVKKEKALEAAAAAAAAAELIAAAEAAKAEAETKAARQRAMHDAEKAAAAAKALKSEKAKRATEAEAEAKSAAAAAAAAKGRVKVPPPGAPPQEKMRTTGALKMLAPKDDVGDAQQSLLRALIGHPPPKPKKKKSGPCDKCDGPHHADDCPHYPKKRVKHEDAWDGYEGIVNGVKQSGHGGGDDGAGSMIVKDATVVPQPGDGSCLFHSLNHGIPNGGGGGATELRRVVADYVENSQSELISGTPIKDWIMWDSGLSPQDYAARMRTGNHWGGAIEIAVCSIVKGVAVQVFERSSDGFERISVFGDPKNSKVGTVNLLYSGRCHYDALRLARL